MPISRVPVRRPPLTAGYSRSVLGDTRGAGVMAALLTGLYLFLQAEDYAMLAGALGLSIILASAIFVPAGRLIREHLCPTTNT